MSIRRTSIRLWYVVAVSVALMAAACAASPAEPALQVSAEPEPAQTTAGDAVENTRELLSRQLHIAPEQIEVVAVESVEWPDACLGARSPEEACAEVITPGTRITLQVEGEEYKFHTDRDGYRSRVVAAPAPQTGPQIVTWSGMFDSGECMEALIGTEAVAFGLCGSDSRIGGAFTSPARTDVLKEWAAAYAPFDAETPYGTVQFAGTGTTAPTPEEQERIAHWASLAAREAAAGQSVAGLGYRGPAEMGSPDTSKCAALQINNAAEAGIGTCDGAMRSEPIGERMAREWMEITDRFASFTYETPAEAIAFEGMGGVAGEQWKPALLAWARGRYAELSTGRTSATINTALSWHLGQDTSQKNICMHLTVLDYGYAYAEEILCEGQDLVNSAQDWLTSDELAALNVWLYERAPLYAGQNYIDGKGSQSLSDPEIAEANQWAMNVWNRIRNSGEEIAAAPVCPEARDGLAMVREYGRGFCMLVPATHTVFDVSPEEIVLARDSLLDVSMPRLYVKAIGAEGRSADQFADDIVASMPGFAIERSNREIAGQQAVVLDNVPGQDLNRRVLIVLDDRFYEFMFTPSDHANMEEFYSAIIDDLVFVEPE